MVHYITKCVRCPACTPIQVSVHGPTPCHECKGRRYIDYRNAICEGEEHYEAMTGGWECYDCGSSGPL